MVTQAVQRTLGARQKYNKKEHLFDTYIFFLLTSKVAQKLVSENEFSHDTVQRAERVKDFCNSPTVAT